jgi:hypothetical protein
VERADVLHAWRNVIRTVELFDDDLDAVAERLDEAAVRARADLLRTRGPTEPIPIKAASR